MRKLGILIILLILCLNLKSQQNLTKTYQFKLTSLSERIIDMFINDSMNLHRIDPSSHSLVLSFGDVQDSTVELWIMDDELIKSCVNDIFITKYKDFNIFYNGLLLPKYIKIHIAILKINCTCDSLLKKYPKGEEIIFSNHDSSIYLIKKETTIKDIKFMRIQGG